MSHKFSPGVLLIQNALLSEIERLAPKPKDRIPPTNSDCSFVCYINDGRGDLKSCGTVMRMCIAKDHHKFVCGAGKDHTYPLSLVDRALIMGLALLYERESGYPWSITHRPTEAFLSCFPVERLPLPDNREEFLKALQGIVQRGVKRWSSMPGETSVSERIRPPLEGLLGWHDFGSEDGSYNEEAHSAVEQTATESLTEKARSPASKPTDLTTNAPALGEASSSKPIRSGEQVQLSKIDKGQGAQFLAKLKALTTNAPALGEASSSKPIRSGEQVQLSKIDKGQGAHFLAKLKATLRPVRYTEIHSRKHAASSTSRNHKYIGTILIPDTEDEADAEEDKRSSKKRKSE